MNVINSLVPEALTTETPVPAWPNAPGTARLIQRLVALYGAAAVAVTVAGFTAYPLAVEARRSGLLGVVLASLLLCLTGLVATWVMARARKRGVDVGRMARRPQGIIVPILAGGAISAAWALSATPPASMAHAALLGGGLIVLTFPLLVAERFVAGLSSHALPEAPALQALLFAPVVALPLAGALHSVAGLGMAWAGALMAVPALMVGVIAAELVIRSVAVWFLLPPPAHEARAAIGSVAALLLQPGRLAEGGLATPIRTHLGLDFSRSWALRYLRAATLPVAALMILLGWGLTGVALISLDGRGVYERLGAPVAVWQPGLHVGLPWPLGRVRSVELGVVHAVPLGTLMGRIEQTGAEAPAPASADRLWDRSHPGEIAYLVASQGSAGEQGFQSVSVDLTVLYRFGLDDEAARRAAYAQVDADKLVRSEASRLTVQLCAGRTLDSLLGEDRASIEAGLRTGLQEELNGLHSGIELLAIEIEAIHPPADAASAYHAVQAAGIIASTAIATESGRAQATASMSRQQAADLTDRARATGAEAVGAADVDLRQFTADHAASAGGAFLLERYLTNLSAALPRTPLVIVDHRLRGADAPTIDLRPGGAPTAPNADE